MKLSIIIPVYRNETTLERCLLSILRQTFCDWELIMVDDGSPDGCPEICDRWAEKDSRCLVIHKDNGGLSDARNAGLQRAQGDYVTFVDADDYVSSNTYELLMPMLSECDLLEYPIYCHYGSSRQRLLSPGENCYHEPGEYWLKGHAYEHSYACNKIFRRSLFQNIKFPTGRVFEDMATLPLLIQEASCIRTTNSGCYYYVENTGGITSTATGKELDMLLQAHRIAMQHWCDDRYYMYVFNIQLDVCRLTGQPPQLPARHVNPFCKGLNMRLRIKAILLNFLGINKLCSIQTNIPHR
ncbi:MAG: glycosyltransferase [Prevotella sp.]|nr:glycosyltransferase [Prevotella sp.]